MHHLLSTSRQAALVVPVHGYVNSVKTSLSAALEELQRTLQAFGPHVEAMESAFPRLMQPTLHLKVFETLASTLGAEWGWQWKTRFEGFARASDPMNRLDRDPWKGLDWKKVFDGVEPDAGIVRDFVLEFSRRVDSFAEHIYSGRDPNDWWPARQSEERQRFERALESRAELLTSEQRELIPAMLDELYPDVKT